MRYSTLADIEAAFEIENKKITTPGPYCGQPRWAPYFAEKSEQAGKQILKVRPDDAKEFPELRRYKVVHLTINQETLAVSVQAFMVDDYW
jgi:hypothetical protein